MMILGLAAIFLLAGWQFHQASLFIRQHEGQSLTMSSVYCVALFCSLSMIVWLLGPDWQGVILILLLAFFLPLLLLDWHCYWLPLPFTGAFWLAGLLSSFLPGAFNTPLLAFIGSGVMFVFLAALRAWVNRRHQCEALGLGDVYLMAGLCAWLPAATGALLCAIAFLLMLPSVIYRRKEQPFAPYLFAVLVPFSLI